MVWYADMQGLDDLPDWASLVTGDCQADASMPDSFFRHLRQYTGTKAPTISALFCFFDHLAHRCESCLSPLPALFSYFGRYYILCSVLFLIKANRSLLFLTFLFLRYPLPLVISRTFFLLPLPPKHPFARFVLMTFLHRSKRVCWPLDVRKPPLLWMILPMAVDWGGLRSKSYTSEYWRSIWEP